MRTTRALIPTLKEAPADAKSISHILLLRAGYIRRTGAGIYSYLPLGLKVLRRIETVVREEMALAHAQELLLPSLLPADYVKETGRWESFGDALFRLQDRKGADYILGPTHEETITDLARREIRSYRDLPQTWYQIQNKYRDEPRPRGGILRGREFVMKDAYSFDLNEQDALKNYEIMRGAYCRIFDRLGLNYRVVGAASGGMGGSKSSEFQVLVQSGEDFIATCPSCDYAENLEVAQAHAPLAQEAISTTTPMSEVETKGKGNLKDVTRFLKKPESKFFKTLVYQADEKVVMVVVRGDHQVNELKLAEILSVEKVKLAPGELIKKTTGSPPAFVGPVGFNGRVLIDHDATLIEAGVCGASRVDYHLQDVAFGRDFQAEVLSLRMVTSGDSCPRCQAALEVYRGIEAGHIFVLGTHYSEKMKALYLDEKGEKKPLVMGCYGIGISRLIAAIIEQHHDESGLVWPPEAAPYSVHICQLGHSSDVVEAVARLESEFLARGIEPLIDDRDERPGIKFKDADLIGLPFRITVGERGLKEAQVEFSSRSATNPKTSLALDDATEYVAAQIENY